MKTYEIRIGDKWFKVRGTTTGLREGWLSWTDRESTGLARPGTWRPYVKSEPHPEDCERVTGRTWEDLVQNG
jgi:hypothetical protein